MNFLTWSIVFLSLTMVSCNRDFKNVRQKVGGEKTQELNIIHNELNVEIVKNQKVAISVARGRKNRRMQIICRGVEGCLHVCEYFKHKKCKQFSVDQVVSFWLGKIGSYTEWAQAEKDLNLIATEPEVSAFLKNVDRNNNVPRALFSLNTSAECPMGEQNIFYSYSPEAALYVGPKLDIEPPAASTGAEAKVGEDVVSCAEPNSSAEARAEVGNADSGGGSSAGVPADDDGQGNTQQMVAVQDGDGDGDGDGDIREDVAPPAPPAGPNSLDNKPGNGGSACAELDSSAGAQDTEKLARKESDQDSQIVLENKKIVDGKALLQFNLPIFRGFIKKCFGHKTKSFSEMAVDIENYSAFEIGHDVLSLACAENSECIRLAYCAIDSELVWKRVAESLKAGGCEYENFVEMM